MDREYKKKETRGRKKTLTEEEIIQSRKDAQKRYRESVKGKEKIKEINRRYQEKKRNLLNKSKKN